MGAVDSGENLFITGRAGTGKSTLLELVVSSQRTADRLVAVVAPTGVAALNVSGLTIHSLFGFSASAAPGLRQYRAPSLLSDLDLLVVDEVSMVRADLMDMMDLALRRARKSAAPFGGLQMLLVGDLFQLPPVVTESEANLVLSDYVSPFFFSSKSIEQLTFRTIDLPDVFRQTDSDFIALLNSVRDGTAGEEEIDKINALVVEDVEAPAYRDYITLATTNKVAEKINSSRLEQLGTDVHRHVASFGGDFDAKTYKVDVHVSFAVGAQVMMLINDGSFANGSLGRIHGINYNAAGVPSVGISLNDSGETVWVGPHRWSIVQPRRTGKHLENVEVGFFEQLPFKLAWAVTVHKSQGKTFDNVIFDKGRSVFAEGQLYVALSRCRTIEGLALAKPIRQSDVKTSRDVVRFHRQQTLRARRVEGTPITFLGFVETGGGEYSKLAEVALIRLEEGREVIFSSLVNPLRDLAEARETGLTAENLTLAPSVIELESLIEFFIAGSVLVGERVGRFLDLMGFSTRPGVGEGLEVAEAPGRRTDTARRDALQTARHAREWWDSQAEKDYIFKEFSAHPPDLRSGSFFTPREPDAVTTASRLIEHFRCVGRSAEFWLAAEIAPFVGNEDHQPPIAPVAVDLSTAVRDGLIAAALRDGVFADREAAVIRKYCVFWGINMPSDLSAEQQQLLELWAGMQVCLTGEPPHSGGDENLRKAALRGIMEEKGIKEVQSVTISRCDLVVAFSSSSMSGKAKKARSLGKPVISADQFVVLLAELEL